MKSSALIAIQLVLIAWLAAFHSPAPSGIRVADPYNVQIQMALSHMAKCSPASFALVIQSVDRVEFDGTRDETGHDGRVSFWAPGLVSLSKSLFTEPPYSEQSVMRMLVHEARHAWQLKRLDLWLELPRRGWDEWCRMLEEDANIFMTNIANDCELR